MKHSKELLSLLQTFANSYHQLSKSLGLEEDLDLVEKINQVVFDIQKQPKH